MIANYMFLDGIDKEEKLSPQMTDYGLLMSLISRNLIMRQEGYVPSPRRRIMHALLVLLMTVR